jgi:hypothetical protein
MDERRPVPWFRVGVAAGVGALGLIVSLAVVAPIVVLGAIVALAATGCAGYLLARRAWGAGSTPRVHPSADEVERIAEEHRAAARERHARTAAVVGAGLVGPGFARSGTEAVDED